LRQIVLPNRYLKNNPFLAVPAVIQDVPEAERGQGGAGAKVYPISKTFTTSSLHTGHFTAACSVTIYEGDLLPKAYRGSAFTCEPTGNLVHQEVIQPNGATFRSRPARDGVEFLATTDPWFRPVNLTVGPDGALYVVDMYRAVIEHPEFMPPELKNRPDLNLGKNRGRIWRIVPDGKTDRPNRPLLNKASTPDLVAVLGHPNSWQRTTAQRLLLQRQDPKAPPLLREVVRGSDRPLARLQAAWLLEGVKALDDDLLLGLLKDDEAGVREHAVRIAEGRLATSETLRNQVLALGDDPDPRVRFQVALSLGQSKDPDVLTALAKIALAGAGDRWTRLAVASAIPERAGALLTTLLRPPYSLTRQADADRLALLNELTALVGARRDPGEVADTLDALLSLDGPTAPRWTMAGLQGIAEGMGRRGTQLGAFLDSMTAKATDPAQTKGLVDRVNAHLARSAAVALNSDADLSARLDAVRLLAHAPWETAHDALAKLVQEGSTVQELRLAAIRALAAHRRPEVAPLLLERWQAYTPAVRHEAADALLRQPDRVQVLLTELEAGRVRPGDLDTAQTRRLLGTGSAENKARARTLLQAAQPEERRQVLDRYQAALTRPGDLHRGLDVFRKSCATCHRVAGVGVEVGPDIGDTRTKTRAALLENILSPNSAIDGNYVGYVVVLKDGGVLEGVLSAETASSISLRRAEGKTDVVLRSDIEELRSTGLSLMPEGLEREIDVPAMADLLEFLKNWRYLDDAAAKPTGE
jgi:putative heme-binding domain-containing protein